jgi:hypothetical protein
VEEDEQETDGHEKEALGDNEVVNTTRSGRVVRIPPYLGDNYETSNLQISLTSAEEKYYTAMATMEFGFPCVGDGVESPMVAAGIGSGYVNTNELHSIKYEEAMSSKERPLSIKAIEEEFSNMTDHGVFQAVEKSKVRLRLRHGKRK